MPLSRASRAAPSSIWAAKVLALSRGRPQVTAPSARPSMNRQAKAPPQPATALPASIRCSGNASSRPEAAMSARKASSCGFVSRALASYSVSPAPTAQAVLGMIRRMGQPGAACSSAAMVTPAAMDTSTGLSVRCASVGAIWASTPAMRLGLTPRKI